MRLENASLLFSFYLFIIYISIFLMRQAYRAKTMRACRTHVNTKVTKIPWRVTIKKIAPLRAYRIAHYQNTTTVSHGHDYQRGRYSITARPNSQRIWIPCLGDLAQHLCHFLSVSNWWVEPNQATFIPSYSSLNLLLIGKWPIGCNK